MGAHSMMLNKEEIWTLVHYVNQFRFDDYGSFEEEETVVLDSSNATVPEADALSTEEL
jgi:hypothetical protein